MRGCGTVFVTSKNSNSESSASMMEQMVVRGHQLAVALATCILLVANPCLAQDRIGERPSLLDRVGFMAEVDAGFSARFNGYSTYEPLLQTQIPVEYDTKTLSVFDLHVEAGVLKSELVGFDYQTSVPRTEFQEEALAYREDRAFGLEKYTFGIDTTPLWLLILPDDASGIVKRILALRFRSIRELSQSNATVTEASLALPTGAIDDYGEVAHFEPLGEGASYSFKTRYRYNSISLPLLFFVENRGRVNVGVARWTFSRSYAARLPNLANQQVIFDATNETNALIAELYLDLHQGALGGFEFDMFYGYGIDSDWTGEDVNLDRLFFSSGEDQVDITNHNLQIRGSYPFTFFEDRDRLSASIKVGMGANTFTTAFSNFEEEVGEEEGFRKMDWILNPSVRLSLRY